MENNFQEDINEIFNERRLQRYYGEIFVLTKRKDLLVGDPLSIAVEFITSIISKKWPKKTMQSYLLRLLSIKQVAENVAKWRSDYNKSTILHLACQNARLGVIGCIISQCGEDLINELNGDNEPPLFYLKFNNSNIDSASINNFKDILELLINKTNDGEKVLKRSLSDLDQRSTSLISACFDLYEHHSTIDNDIILTILKFYYGDIAIWNRTKQLRIRAAKIKSLLKTLKLPHEACVELLQIFERGRYFHHIISLQPEVLTFILTNLDRSKMVFNTPFMNYNVRRLKEAYWMGQLDADAKIDLIATMIDSPEFMKQMKYPDLANSRVFDVPHIYELLTTHNFYHRLKNVEFKREKLRQATQHYVHGIVVPSNIAAKHNVVWHVSKLVTVRAIDNHVTYQISLRRILTLGSLDAIEFPVLNLPNDLICVIMSLLPYQQMLAFGMACKRFCELLDSHVVWRRKFHEMFPFDTKPKEFNRQSVVARYKNKFKASNREDISEVFTVPSYKVDVHQNIITNCHDSRVGVYDLETKHFAEINIVGQRTGRTRRFKDTLYISSDAGVELLSLHNNKSVGRLNIVGLENQMFDVNDQWLVSNTEVYDTTTGQRLSQSKLNSDEPKNPVLLRKDIAIRVANNGAYDVTDLRANLTSPVHIPLRRGPKRGPTHLPVSLNASESYIYLSHNEYVEISDMRKPTEPVWISPLALQHTAYSTYGNWSFIDLVSMNVWCSYSVWDLANYKWETPKNTNLYERYALWMKCNGKHAIYFDAHTLKYYKLTLAGSEYF